MKLKIKTSQLKSLTRHNTVIKKCNLHCLYNYHIASNGNNLYVTAGVLTDREHNYVTLSNECWTEREGEALVDAAKFHKIIAKLPDCIVDIEYSGGKVIIRSDNSKFELESQSTEYYPELSHDGKDITIEAANFISKLGKIDYAMARNDVRYFLNGICLKVSDSKMNIVATDGHRMAYDMVETSAPDCELIIPRDAVAKIKKYLTVGGIQITKYDNSAIFSDGISSVKTDLIDGRYPDFNRVIPANNNKQLVANKKALIKNIELASVLANEGICLYMYNDSLTFSATNPDHETSEVSQTCEYKDAEFKSGYQSKYLIESLKKIESDQAYLYFSDPKMSVIIREGSTGHIIMPIRL